MFYIQQRKLIQREKYISENAGIMKTTTRGEPLDRYLAELGLWRKSIAKDGFSLFRAVSEQLFLSQVYHVQVRDACVKYMSQYPAKFEHFIQGPFESHLRDLNQPKECAGHAEICALSLIYKRDFIIYQELGKPVNVTRNGFGNEVLLCYSEDFHFDSVYSLSYLNSAAICQSIIYEVLYRNVFKMSEEIEIGIEMIRNKSFQKHRKDSVGSVSSDKGESPPPPENQHEQDEDGKMDKKKLLEQYQYPPFPFRIAKALDPEIYRNVEYDTWMESKKEHRLKDPSQARELQYAPGDKCQVTVEGHGDRVFHAFIQEMSRDQGPVTVFLEELGERHTIPFANLRPLPQPQPPQHGWTSAGKKQTHMSGFYQKSPLLEDSASNSLSNKKKLHKKKKEIPFFMPLGRGQPLPPRLQQQGERASYPRGASRTPPPRFGSNCGLFNSSGRPINKQWNSSDNLKYVKPRHGDDRFLPFRDVVPPSCTFFPPTTPEGLEVPWFRLPVQHRHQMQDLEKKAMEESAALYELQERDPNAFPALPSVHDRNGSGPCSFWNQDKGHQGHHDGSGQADDSAFLSHDMTGGASGVESTADSGVGCRADGISPTPPQPIPQVHRQLSHHALSKAASPVASPTVSTPPPLPPSPISQKIPPPPGMVPPAWSVPYYYSFVIPHMENLTGPVNYGASPSRDVMGNDLPLNDITTLRFFFNLGVEYHRFHAAMVQMQSQQQYAAYCTQQAFQVTCYQPPPPVATLTQGRPPQIIQAGRLDQSSLVEDETNPVNGQSDSQDSPDHDRPSSQKKLTHKKEEVSVAQSSEEDGSNCSDCTNPGCSLNDSGCVSDISLDCSQKNQIFSSKDDSDQFSPERQESESSDNQSNHSDSFSQHSNASSGSSNDCQPTFTNRPRRPAFIKKINGVTHRLLRPIKDIPPRFQRILSAETSKQHNWKLEGPPLVVPMNSMSPEYVGSPTESSESSQISFNPNAQCFIPGQVYSSSEPAGQGYCAAVSNTTSAVTQPATYVESMGSSNGVGGLNGTVSTSGAVVSGTTSSCGDNNTPAQQLTAAPTYTIHLTGAPPNYSAAYGDGNCCFASSVPPFSSTAGYYPTPGSPSAGPVPPLPQGTVYYSSEVFPSQQQFVPYQPPVMYAPAPLQQGQYQQAQYPMSV